MSKVLLAVRQNIKNLRERIINIKLVIVIIIIIYLFFFWLLLILNGIINIKCFEKIETQMVAVLYYT